MDAQAYLRRHGWTGPGNPLNPHRRSGAHGGLGLTRPLLAARKQNTLGLGRKMQDPGNQWWLRGFDDALKGVGTAESGVGNGGGSGNALGSELYRFFVRGEGLRGTIHEEEKGTKRKRSGEEGEGEGEGKNVLRKQEKKMARNDDSTERKESKEERRARKQGKREKRARKEKRRSEKRSQPVDTSKKSSRKEKRREKTSAEDDYPTPGTTEPEQEESSVQDEPSESKDASKQKREKKERKEKKEKKERKERKKEKESKKKVKRRQEEIQS